MEKLIEKYIRKLRHNEQIIEINYSDFMNIRNKDVLDISGCLCEVLHIYTDKRLLENNIYLIKIRGLV